MYGLIGRDDVLVKKEAALLLKDAKKRHHYKPLVEIHRGYTFELQLLDEKDAPTGHVVKVTVTLERVEPEILKSAATDARPVEEAHDE